MKTICLLGLEDADGWKRLQSGKIGIMTHDAECHWAEMTANDVVFGVNNEILCGDPLMPDIRKQGYQPGRNAPVEEAPKAVEPPELPIITYQVQFGNDQ